MNFKEFTYFLTYLQVLWRICHFFKLEILLIPQVIAQEFLNVSTDTAKIVLLFSIIIWGIAVIRTVIAKIKGV